MAKKVFLLEPEEYAAIKVSCENILFVLRTEPDVYVTNEIRRNVERILSEGLGLEEGEVS